MTIEEVFSDLYDKYGEDFNWYMLPLTQADGMFVTELKNEIGEDHFLYDKRIWAVAKCESNDDVLYVTKNGLGEDVYYIFHLTYSKHNSDGFPRYERFADIFAVKEFLEQSYVKDYL
ncbi:hypothetical protein LIR45_12490 [Lachnospiraceae bacterium EP-SM-12S-S03]|nr:hypothetical protein [Lachnospiraceae bacterium EP-SM-12S-S03]